MPGLEQELTDLKAEFNTRIEVARAELTSEATRTLALAAKERNETESRLREAEQKFSSTGLESLMTYIKTNVIEARNFAEPSFWDLPANANPLILTLWGWPAHKASLWFALRSGWTADTQEFRQAALRIFIAAQETFPTEPPRDGIPTDVQARREFFTEAAKRFGNGCYEAINEQADSHYRARFGEFQRQHLHNLASQELEMSRLGAGRVPLVAEQPTSPTGFTGECLDPANCCCPKHRGLPPHLTSDPWLGTKRDAPIEGINDVRPMAGEMD